jgi:hypothetical protein
LSFFWKVVVFMVVVVIMLVRVLRLLGSFMVCGSVEVMRCMFSMVMLLVIGWKFGV